MKTFVTILVLLISAHLVYGQVKTITVSEKRMANNGATLLCTYNKAISERGDTSRYILLMFRDLQFEMLEEYRCIRFVNSKKSNAEVFQFVKDLKAACAKMNGKTEVTCQRELYEISTHDSSDLLYLEEVKKSGYTALNKGNVEKLINWLGEIGFKI